MGPIDDLLSDVGLGPEIILPIQVVRPEQPTAEMRLILAVLEDAIRIHLKFKNRGHKPPRYFETVEWFESEATTPFSFHAICDACGFDVQSFRKRLHAGVITVPIRRQHAQNAQPTAKGRVAA